MPRRKTYHDGANEVRTMMLAKLRRELKYYSTDIHPKSAPVHKMLKKLIAFVLEQNERTDKRAGGLGKK